MRCRYREMKYYSGDYLDVQIYPVYKKADKRAKKYKPTHETQLLLNKKNAKKNLTRLVHANFTRKDYFITVTYDDDELPTSPQEAKRDMQNYIRRLRRYYLNQEKEFKYVYVTENGGKSNRLHHHMIISGSVDRTEMEELWGKGYANSRTLQFRNTGVAGIINYMLKKPLFKRSWSASQNLKEPRRRKNDHRFSRRKAFAMIHEQDNARYFENLYPGYFFTDCEAVPINEVNGGTYLYLRLYKKTAKIE